MINRVKGPAGSVIEIEFDEVEEDIVHRGVYYASIISVRLVSGANTDKESCMKLVNKADLEFVDGRLVDTEGNVVSPRRLVAEVNELAEIRAVVDFVKANASKIKAPTEQVTFTLPKVEAPRLKSEKVAATPLNDEHKAAAEARATEFLNAQVVGTTNEHLARYKGLAHFFAENHIVVDGDATDAQFLIDPLTLTEESVVETVEEYRDPEISRLVKLIHIVP